MREMRQRVPFRPFAIGLVDGRRFLIPHPDFLTISQTGRHVVVYEQRDSQTVYIDMMLIVSIEVAESPTAEGAEALPESGGE